MSDNFFQAIAHISNKMLSEISLSINCDYCKFEIVRVYFIFANSVKRHICEVVKARLGPALALLMNDRVISPFCDDFIFTKLRTCDVSRK